MNSHRDVREKLRCLALRIQSEGQVEDYGKVIYLKAEILAEESASKAVCK